MAHNLLVSIQPSYKEVWHAFRSCATPLLLAIILMRVNAYSRALAMLHLSGTVCMYVCIYVCTYVRVFAYLFVFP